MVDHSHDYRLAVGYWGVACTAMGDSDWQAGLGLGGQGMKGGDHVKKMPKCYQPCGICNTDCGNAVHAVPYVDEHSIALAFRTGGDGQNVLICQKCEWKTEKK